MSNNEKLPRVKFSAVYSGDKTKQTIDEIKELLLCGTKIKQESRNLLIKTPDDYREVYCLYFDNKLVRFYQNKGSVSVIEYIDNSEYTLNKRKVKKEFLFSEDLEDCYDDEDYFLDQVDKAIYNGVWIPDFKIGKNGKQVYSSKYIVDDFCVDVIERKTDFIVEKTYNL